MMEYLASPYSDPDPTVQEDRFHKTCRAMAGLFVDGRKVFSPIAHCHPIHNYGLAGDFEFWQAYNREWIDMCDGMIVLRLDGWVDSMGVRAEIEYAQSLGILVEYLDYSTAIKPLEV